MFLGKNGTRFRGSSLPPTVRNFRAFLDFIPLTFTKLFWFFLSQNIAKFFKLERLILQNLTIFLLKSPTRSPSRKLEGQNPTKIDSYRKILTESKAY